MIRLLVCGSREWPGTWEQVGVHFPDHCDPSIDVTIIHGACSRLRGGVQVSVDMIADFVARGLGFPIEAYPVDHDKDGPWPGAGPMRNTRMLRDGKPNIGLAFGALWKPSPYKVIERVTGSKAWGYTGTGGMVAKMLRAGLPVRWVAAPDAPAVDLVAMPEPPR